MARPSLFNRNAFRALEHPNFRLYFIGQALSLVGSWTQQVALSWLTWRLTHSPLILGLVSFAQHLAVVFLAPFAGVLADRVDRRKAVFTTQTMMAALSVLLAAMTLSGRIDVPWILAIVFATGTVSAFDVSLRSALLVKLVERKTDLPNAIALNSMLVHLARVIGPAAGGLLIGLIGEGGCFTINAVSFAAVLVALARMRWPEHERSVSPAGIWASFVEGLRYAAGFLPIRVALILVAAFSFTIGPYSSLMPVFASEVFGGGPSTLGTLLAAVGAGALGGTVYLAHRPDTRSLDRITAVAGTAAGIGMIGFAASRHIALALPFLALMGGGFILGCAALNTLIQTLVDEDKRGRVVSLYMVAFIGVAPFGNLLAGALAREIGAHATFVINGSVAVLAALWFQRMVPRLRVLSRPALARAGQSPPG